MNFDAYGEDPYLKDAERGARVDCARYAKERPPCFCIGNPAFVSALAGPVLGESSTDYSSCKDPR